jgi:hypothetical protein
MKLSFFKKLALAGILVSLPLSIISATDQKAADLVKRLNQRYYDLKRENFHSFECDVDIFSVKKDGVEGLSNSHILRRFIFKEGTNSRLEPRRHVKDKLDAPIGKAASEICSGAFDEWLGIADSPLIDADKGSEVDAHPSPTGYSLVFHQTGEVITMEFDKADMVTKISMLKQKLEMSPIFESTEDGLVIKKFETKMAGVPDSEVWLHNAKVVGYWVPDSIKTHSQVANSQVDVEIRLSNFRINGGS